MLVRGGQTGLTKGIDETMYCPTPSHDFRNPLGQPKTLGEFRNMTRDFADDTPLAVRNAPLPVLYHLCVEGLVHVEIEIPDAIEVDSLDGILEWAAWIDHLEGTSGSAGEKALCVAHAILDAVCDYEEQHPE